MDKETQHFLKMVFSLNVFKASTGESLADYRRNFHLDLKALKGMTVQPSQIDDNIVVSGFLLICLSHPLVQQLGQTV